MRKIVLLCLLLSLLHAAPAEDKMARVPVVLP
jgi:hypothetical protein